VRVRSKTNQSSQRRLSLRLLTDSNLNRRLKLSHFYVYWLVKIEKTNYLRIIIM
jgi:hypothetical protein